MVTGYIYKCELARAPFQLYQKHFVKKRSKGGFHFQRRTWRPRALNCLFTVKTNSNTKDSLFLKEKSNKTRRVTLGDCACDTSNVSISFYSTLKRASLFSREQVKARGILHLRGKCRPIHCALS